MANIVYQAGLRELLIAATDFATGDWEMLLESSTSTYAPNKDDDSLLDKAGWDEIDVVLTPSYVRQNLAGKVVSVVDGSDRVMIDCNNVAFGNLEAGATVKAVHIARNDGGNYVPFMRIDTDAGGLLPRALGGGAFSVHIHADGLAHIAQA